MQLSDSKQFMFYFFFFDIFCALTFRFLQLEQSQNSLLWWLIVHGGCRESRSCESDWPCICCHNNVLWKDTIHVTYWSKITSLAFVQINSFSNLLGYQSSLPRSQGVACRYGRSTCSRNEWGWKRMLLGANLVIATQSHWWLSQYCRRFFLVVQLEDWLRYYTVTAFRTFYQKVLRSNAYQMLVIS